ncbi:hypothetical protein NB231_14368 [Nitrococcus mobilis Nb-231]|uniref:Uncharacterized protein n=1 Tax=Nitrococcus mobilis Nb-231 TaxID=314278 RepID=A4BL24_9GAMM|nr:hypothetical protein NB231_14368 [Nitrococcus mobilis Nb-231]
MKISEQSQHQNGIPTKPEAVRYVAEVQVDLIEDESGWSPYLSVGDAPVG